MEATVAEAVEQTAAPIDADLVPDPVPSRTNSNATVARRCQCHSQRASATASEIAAVDAYVLDGMDESDL